MRFRVAPPPFAVSRVSVSCFLHRLVETEACERRARSSRRLLFRWCREIRAWIEKGISGMSWIEIKSLVERAQLGDRAAYGELIERFQPTVYALAMTRLRNPTEAQELTQEVFLHGMKKLPQLRDAQCFAGWLRQITVRMALNRLTRRGPLQKAEPELLENAEASTVSPLEAMVKAEQAAELYRGLDRLKPIDRATLMAFYIRGRSLKQMSREFETPIGTIKRRLHVARNRLKKVMERGGTVKTRRREPVCV
jgi:RNA polymerase sigma-70 factor (ECF subfamily)